MTLQTDIQKLVTDALPNAAPGSGYGYIAPDAAHVCGGVGVSNIATKAPFTALTRFRICSVTKQFTTVLTMMAAAEGLLKISDHPKLYYPDLGCDHPDLTLRHLMTNQSGIKDYWCVAMTMGARPETQFTRAHTDMLLAAPLQLDFEPGSQFAYSNTNFALLGRILDLVYRQPFAALVHDKLFAPLGMANSFVPASTAVPLPGNPQGYEDEGLPADVNLSWEGDAGIISTIADMQRWQSAQLDANHWLQTYFKACYAPGNFKDGGIASYRCGIRRIEREGGLELAHTGGLRGWRMASVLRLESGEAALVMLNHMADPMPLARAILNRQPPAQMAQISTDRILDTHWLYCRDKQLIARLDTTATGRRLTCGSQLCLLDQSEAYSAHEIDDALKLSLPSDNITILFETIKPTSDQAPAGRYRCDALDSEIEVSGNTLVFHGPLGASEHYALQCYEGDIATIGMPRALDFAPPGQITLAFDAAGAALGCWSFQKLRFERVQ